MASNYSVNVFVGNYGMDKISSKTLKAFELGDVDFSNKKWRRSSTLRRRHEQMEECLASVQHYRWLRDDEETDL